MKHLIAPLFVFALLLPGCSGDSCTQLLPVISSSSEDSRPSPPSVQLAYLTQWGTEGSAAGQFSSPSGIAVDTTDQKVFVGDAGNCRIQVFDYSGNFLSEWGACGNTTPYLGAVFTAPSKVEYDKVSDRLLVFDEYNKRAVVFTGDGTFITYAEHGSGGAWEGLGAGSVNSADGRIYAADPLSNSIFVLDIGGGLVEAWNFAGYTPFGTGYDPHSGRIYAAGDSGSADNYALVLDSNGNTTGQIPRFRSDNGFYTAGDVEVDPRTGMVFTLENIGSRIQVVNRNFEFLTDRGGAGGAGGPQSGQLLNPEQMSYDPDSKLLFVADTGNNRIQVFQVIY